MAEYRAGRPAGNDLAACLALSLSPEACGALRLRLLAGGWRPVLALAAERRLLPALAAAAPAKGLLAGIPQQRSATGEASVPALLADAQLAHVERQAVLRARLAELLDIFAGQGIQPVLLKGARALWTGEPGWRSLRDLDLLVAAPAGGAAVALAIASGYHPNAAFAAPAGWHHGAELYRDDLPGWIEIHERGGVRRMEAVLPSAGLIGSAIEVAGVDGGGTALALPMPLHILFSLAHHHIGHRGDYFGVIDFKGLYEFAADIAALDAAGRADLLCAAEQHPRLLAMLDLWLAAAADVFALAVEPPLFLADDARRHWQLMRDRAAENAPSRRFAGLRREVAMAFAGSRLRRLPGGATRLGRLRLRSLALRAIARRATDGQG